MKSFLLLCFVALTVADVKHLTDRNLDLFKYNPSDIYTLPEDIDDDKPAVHFSGDVMKAKTETLQNYNSGNKFKLALKTQNGIEVNSVGKLKDDKTFVVSGSYSFTGADGKRYRTRYTADEFGYHPITELDLDIPEPQPLSPVAKRPSVDPSSLLGNKNRFQFLQQSLNPEQGGPLRGSGQSGDDYSYSAPGPQVDYNNNPYGNGLGAGNPYGSDGNGNGFGAGTGTGSGFGSGFGAGNPYGPGSAGGNGNGYNYQPPSVPLDTPSRQYLPVA
ncbi:cell wall protein IFF6 [Drosophila innubila]|uniref:cell wall protein IFF6 n=1 Tax=Drosophila innubila TaxID=198719 RepID=UPI00148B8AE0|nr:cell wall protein IFF6 [Drosophila innubila]